MVRASYGGFASEHRLSQRPQRLASAFRAPDSGGREPGNLGQVGYEKDCAKSDLVRPDAAAITELVSVVWSHARRRLVREGFQSRARSRLGIHHTRDHSLRVGGIHAGHVVYVAHG